MKVICIKKFGTFIVGNLYEALPNTHRFSKSHTLMVIDELGNREGIINEILK